MKAILLSLALTVMTGTTFAADTASSSTWVETNSVLISHPQNPDIARKDCETTMRILSIMSNDKIVFNSRCEPAYNNPRCNYYYCYQLSARALFVEQTRLQSTLE